jgi:hypothetical protein
MMLPLSHFVNSTDFTILLLTAVCNLIGLAATASKLPDDVAEEPKHVEAIVI